MCNFPRICLYTLNSQDFPLENISWFTQFQCISAVPWLTTFSVFLLYRGHCVVDYSVLIETHQVLSLFKVLILLLCVVLLDFQKVDIYSLGVIFFEMCYHPLTESERYRIFPRIRQRTVDFPQDFDQKGLLSQVRLLLYSLTQAHPLLEHCWDIRSRDMENTVSSTSGVDDSELWQSCGDVLTTADLRLHSPSLS